VTHVGSGISTPEKESSVKEEEQQEEDVPIGVCSKHNGRRGISKKSHSKDRLSKLGCVSKKDRIKVIRSLSDQH
jgi:hypothetical protein